MIRRGVCVAVGLVGVCFAVAAQQENWRGATENDPTFALNLYNPEIFSAMDTSLLFRKGRVHTWSDGGRLTSETALAEIGMASLDLFPVVYVPPNASEATTARTGSSAANSPVGTFGPDAKDFLGMMLPPDQVYYGGEVGILYGRWTGKGGGDLIQSYMLGTVGNDKFQISVGAGYQESSGRSSRYHSYVFPR
jgi:hypothetical protein